MPVDIVTGGIITCILCSICGACAVASQRKQPQRRAQSPMFYSDQPQNPMAGMEMLMQQQMMAQEILAEKEEGERLRNYIRRQKRAAADAILRQEAGITFGSPPNQVAPAPAAPAAVQQVPMMPPRMVVCNPNPGFAPGQPMLSPFMQAPNMPPPAIPIYYLR